MFKGALKQCLNESLKLEKWNKLKQYSEPKRTKKVGQNRTV